MAKAPIETKVLVQASVGGAAGYLASFVLWLLATYVFHHPVPMEVANFVSVSSTILLGFLAGWKARHTSRPDLKETPPVNS